MTRQLSQQPTGHDRREASRIRWLAIVQRAGCASECAGFRTSFPMACEVYGREAHPARAVWETPVPGLPELLGRELSGNES